MRSSFSSLTHNILFLLLFGLLLVCLLMLPVWIVGFPFDFPRLWGVREFLTTGLIPSGDGRLHTLFLAFFHTWIPLENISAWSLINVVVFAVSLIPWWLSVVRLFGTRVAWVSTLITALLPLYWLEVYYVRGYTLALLFLFSSFATFVWLFPRNRIGALVFSGVLFGAAVACKDAFITFIPWYVLVYLWVGRRAWQRGLVECGVFLLCAFIAFSVPLFPQVARGNAPLIERVAVFFPFWERAQVPGGHFYPDLYTQEFEREDFEKNFEEKLHDLSFLERMWYQNYAIRLGIGDGMFQSLGNGAWLLMSQVPYIFHQDTVGGFFLWLFIIPGGIVLYRQKRSLFWITVGLIVSMEFFIRFILHFQRMHLMNVAWILALVAGIGAVDIIGRLWNDKKRQQIFLIILCLIIVGQLLQTNRRQLARLYQHSDVPWIVAQAEILKDMPQNSVVAHPLGNQPFFLADRRYIGFRSETVEKLLDQKKLPVALDHYGVTHVMGFESDLINRIVRVIPTIKTVPLASRANAKVHVTPWMNYLLHLVR